MRWGLPKYPTGTPPALEAQRQRDGLAEMSVYWYTAEDRILNARAIKTPVSFIVHSLDQVNDALAQDEYFFADIVTCTERLREMEANADRDGASG